MRSYEEKDVNRWKENNWIIELIYFSWFFSSWNRHSNITQLLESSNRAAFNMMERVNKDSFLPFFRMRSYMKHCTWGFPICTLFGFCFLCDMDLQLDLPLSSCIFPEVVTIWLPVANSHGVPFAGSLRCSSLSSWTPKWWFEKPCLAIMIVYDNMPISEEASWSKVLMKWTLKRCN